MSPNEPSASTLSAAELAALERWEADHWIPLLVHEQVHHDVEHAFREGTGAVIYGPRGVGKTETVRRAIRTLEARESRRTMEDKTYEPRLISRYTSSTAGGAKTALADLMKHLTNADVANVTLRQSARNFSVAIGQVLQDRNIGLVVIDEAHQIATSNLEHLVGLLDIVREELEHRVGFVFVGNPGIRRALVKIQQMGQRIVTGLEFRAVKREEVAGHLPSFHPHLETLHGRLKKREWAEVERIMLGSMQGSPRRLVRLIELANGLAMTFRTPIDVQALRDAASQLADQI